MNSPLSAFAAILLLMLAAAGCSSPSSRIKGHEAAFAAYPADVQQKIRAGEVAVGFTPDQVKLAMGAPDRVYTRTVQSGVSEIWAYLKKKPSFGLGLGVGSGGGAVGVGTGVGVSTGGQSQERLRVVFVGGKVTAVETTATK